MILKLIPHYKFFQEKKFIVHDNKYYFGIKINLNNGWKTYWKNPGDAGLPIQIKFKNKKYIRL